MDDDDSFIESNESNMRGNEKEDRLRSRSAIRDLSWPDHAYDHDDQISCIYTVYSEEIHLTTV
jgi:hypothetical protein